MNNDVTIKDVIIKSMIVDGWKNAANTEYLGYKFDFVGTKYNILSLANWHILVRFEDKLLTGSGKKIDEEFKNIWKKSKSFVSPKHFLYCIVANNIVDSARKEIGDYHSSGFKLGGVMGAIYLVDLSKEKVHGDIPAFPVVFKLNCEKTIRAFQTAMDIPK